MEILKEKIKYPFQVRIDKKDFARKIFKNFLKRWCVASLSFFIYVLLKFISLLNHPAMHGDIMVYVFWLLFRINFFSSSLLIYFFHVRAWSFYTRRLHDTGKSMGWILPSILLAIFSLLYRIFYGESFFKGHKIMFWLLGKQEHPLTFLQIFLLLHLFFRLCLLIFLLLKESEPGSNEYGPHPNGVGVSDLVQEAQ